MFKRRNNIPEQDTIEKSMVDIVEDHERRVNAAIAGLRNFVLNSILRARQVVNEQQKSTNQNSVSIISPQTSGTEIISNVFINVDPSAGGTMVLTLGQFVLTYNTLPPDGFDHIDNIVLLLRPNDTRQVVVTPSSGTCKYLNLYLQGFEVGDKGGTQ